MLVAGAVAGALTTMQLQAVARRLAGALAPRRVQQLAAVFGMVKSDYVEPSTRRKLINDAIAGMVAGLDPHSQYFDKKSFKEFRESTGGKFVGIGIEMGMEDGLVKVVSPIEGSPAFRAGMKPGDLITRIDDTPVKGLTVDQAVKKMRGDPNTKVVLTVFRKSESRTFPVTIIREEIRMQSVRAKMVEPGYGWLRVSQFQDRTSKTSCARSKTCTSRTPSSRAWCSTCATTRAACSTAPWPLGRLPAARRGGGQHQRPDRRVQGHLPRLARVLRPPRRFRPAAPPARGDEERASGGAGQ
jgi:carboxyl-terminal processing protease